MEAAAGFRSKFAKWWESISPKIDEAVQVTKDKADEFSRIGKLKYEIFQARRVLLKTYQELGEHTYQHLFENPGTPVPDTDDMMERIAEIRMNISDMENEVIHLQTEEEEK